MTTRAVDHWARLMARRQRNHEEKNHKRDDASLKLKLCRDRKQVHLRHDSWRGLTKTMYDTMTNKSKNDAMKPKIIYEAIRIASEYRGDRKQVHVRRDSWRGLTKTMYDTMTDNSQNDAIKPRIIYEATKIISEYERCTLMN